MKSESFDSLKSNNKKINHKDPSKENLKIKYLSILFLSAIALGAQGQSMKSFLKDVRNIKSSNVFYKKIDSSVSELKLYANSKNKYLIFSYMVLPSRTFKINREKLIKSESKKSCFKNPRTSEFELFEYYFYPSCGLTVNSKQTDQIIDSFLSIRKKYTKK